MIYILTWVFLGLGGVSFLYAAATDFKAWKIHNRTVLVLIGVYVPYAALSAQLGLLWPLKTHIPSAFGAGALLFGLGFVFWQFKLFGAGDAKLMFPIGLFVGWANLLHYSIFLVVFALLAIVLLRFPLPYGLGNTWPGMRLAEIRRTGKIPYGVIMVAALFATTYYAYGQASANV